MRNIFFNLLNQKSKVGKRVETFIQLLILYSIATFCFETLPSLDGYRELFKTSEIIVTGTFTIEYVFRLIFSRNRIRFVFSFYGLIDLLAIIPFYLSFGTFDLRTIRVFRFFRVFRALKLVRYSRAIDRLKLAFFAMKEELVIFGILTLFVLFIASVGIYFFEHEAQPERFTSIFDALWWSVATLTTVGYGDVYPITVGGKLFTIVLLFLGLGIVAIPSALLAASLRDSMPEKENAKASNIRKAS